ncbi:hypothetical protein JXB11_00005, partial [Candidatus Woesearchaeota archaeon]|nr:hypothetical protein [Candidatus Woesearchaeota archaeon]
SYVNIENNYGSDLKEMHVVAVIPELGLRVSLGPFTIDDEEEATKRLLVDTYGAEPGDYYVRITVSNDDIRRVKHRIITI